MLSAEIFTQHAKCWVIYVYLSIFLLEHIMSPEIRAFFTWSEPDHILTS